MAESRSEVLRRLIKASVWGAAVQLWRCHPGSLTPPPRWETRLLPQQKLPRLLLHPGKVNNCAQINAGF